MLELSTKAINKILEIMEKQEAATNTLLRIGVVGGGCSGFQYSMAFEPKGKSGLLDKTYEFTGDSSGQTKKLKVIVDQASMLYLDNAKIDYVETLEGSGFKFNNPDVKSTCGCGQSFQA